MKNLWEEGGKKVLLPLPWGHARPRILQSFPEQNDRTNPPTAKELFPRLKPQGVLDQ